MMAAAAITRRIVSSNIIRVIYVHYFKNDGGRLPYTRRRGQSESNGTETVEGGILPAHRPIRIPTDMQPQTVAMLSLAQGTSIMIETVFDNRFGYTEELKKMGADIFRRKSVIIREYRNYTVLM